MNINEKIENYLNEKEDEEEVKLSSENAQKVILLAQIMDMKKKAPLMKRVVAKSMVGKPMSDTEREVLKAIMNRVFRPEKGKFKRLMGKF
jgi:hypothetical protein